MMGFIRRICPFLPIRLKPRDIIRYLFVVAIAFYIVLYSTKNVVENTSCICNCANKSKKMKSTSYLKQGAELAEETNVKGRTMKTFLLVVVLTGPNNVKRRNAMRSTWLNVTRNFISVTQRFVVGVAGIGNETRKLLEEEQNLNGDMLLLENFKDEYKQLTRKLLHALIWISQHVECSYVMKVDDDSFARLDIILSELKTKYHDVDNLYWGFHRGNSRVKYAGPWAEKKWILSDRYLPYALGGGYIISMKLAQYVANISSLVVLYNSEDVSLGKVMVIAELDWPLVWGDAIKLIKSLTSVTWTHLPTPNPHPPLLPHTNK